MSKINPIGLSPDNFFVGNGSEAIINLIPKALAVDGEVVIPRLTFPMFAAASQSAGLKVVTAPMAPNLAIDLKAVERAIAATTRVMFVCNPNNPTGSLLPEKAIKNFLSKVPQSVLVVVDEAGIEFGGVSCLPLVKKRQNLIVLGTFSKAYGLAGLRVGFAVANQAIIESLRNASGPFPITAGAEAATITALNDQEFLLTTREFVVSERTRVAQALTDLGFKVFPSVTNNLFIQIPESISTEQFLYTLELSDTSVILGSKFPGFTDRFFRFCLRKRAQNNRFLAVLKSMSNTNPKGGSDVN